MTSQWSAPAGLTKAVAAALEHGRSFLVSHGSDSGDSPFVALNVKWDLNEVRITWHTRDTGTYRLFSCLVRTANSNWRHVTMAKAIEIVTGVIPEVAA